MHGWTWWMKMLGAIGVVAASFFISLAAMNYFGRRARAVLRCPARFKGWLRVLPTSFQRLRWSIVPILQKRRNGPQRISAKAIFR
jgi:hypothetical protein